MGNVIDIFTGREWEVQRDLGLRYLQPGIGFNEPRYCLSFTLEEDTARKLLKLCKDNGILNESVVDADDLAICRHSNLWWGQV